MVSILDPLVDKAGGIRKTSAWYRNAETVDKTDLPPQSNGKAKSMNDSVDASDDDDTMSYFSKLAEDE